MLRFIHVQPYSPALLPIVTKPAAAPRLMPSSTNTLTTWPLIRAATTQPPPLNRRDTPYSHAPPDTEAMLKSVVSSFTTT